MIARLHPIICTSFEVLAVTFLRRGVPLNIQNRVMEKANPAPGIKKTKFLCPFIVSTKNF